MRVLIYPILLLLTLSISCSRPEGPENRTSELKAELDSLLLKGIESSRNLAFESAQQEFNQLIHLAEVKGSPDHVILGYINLGNLYNYYSLYDQALENLFIALEKSDEFGIDVHKNAIYNNLGIAYSKNGSSEKASEYFEKALDISVQTADTFRIALNLTNLSNSLKQRELNDSALTCLKSALILFDQENRLSSFLATLNNIGSIYLENQELDSAYHFFTRAFHGENKNIEPWLQWEFGLNLARTHFQLGNIDSAQIYLSESLQGFKVGNDPENEIDALLLQSSIHEEKGELDKAIQAVQTSMNINDSLMAVKSNDWISKHQLNYEFGKKEKELEIIEEEARRKQVIWVFGSAGLAIILILVWLLMRSRLTRLNQENLLLEKEQNLTQLTLEKNIANQKRMEEEHAAKEKINYIERQKLQQELDFKNRALMSKVMSISNQNEQMNQVVEILKANNNLDQEELSRKLNQARSLIQSQLNLENEWETVKVHFEEVHPDFFNKLAKHNESLNSSDLRMCAYLVLDLSPKEISNILNIAPASIRKRRQRLKEKLNISTEVDLNDWLRKNILNDQNKQIVSS